MGCDPSEVSICWRLILTCLHENHQVVDNRRVVTLDFVFRSRGPQLTTHRSVTAACRPSCDMGVPHFSRMAQIVHTQEAWGMEW